MTARLALLLAVLTAAANFAGPVQSPRQQPTFRATTTLVSVDVSVRRGNTPVTGLTAGDFELTDNGVRQNIESLSVEAVPIDVSLAVDTSGSVIGNLASFRAEVRRFATLLRPIDRIRVIAFGTAVREIVPMQPATDPLNLDQLAPGGTTSSNDGLFYALLWPTSLERRHLVIALTDGIDTNSTLSSASVIDVANRARAVFHVVLVEGFGPLTAWEKGAREAVIEAAKQSGGAVHDLARASRDFKQIVDDFRASYVLRFEPEGVSKTGWHDLTVTLVNLDPAQHTVRARRGYWGDAR